MMRNCVRLFLICLAAFFFAGHFLPVSSAQKRPAFFSHNTPAHKTGKYKDCSSCHEVPTENWKSARRDKQDPFPDVVSFPYKNHTCNGCHQTARPRISENRGQFCGNCHVVASRVATGGKGVLPFPLKSHPRQFTTYFPHDVHQDIIASNYQKTDVAVAHFILASFAPDEKKLKFNNCEICHVTPANIPKNDPSPLKNPVQPLAGVVAEPDKFEPKAEFFKDMPTSHASCFTCHYDGAKPVAADCAGCHKDPEKTKPYFKSDMLLRYSLRFDHESTDHKKDCTTCHLRITQNSDARLMKDADVPILACSTSACHGGAKNKAKRSDPKPNSFFSSAVSNEIVDRNESIIAKAAVFQCSYCHTSAIGRFPIPMSHCYAVPPNKPEPCKTK